MHCYYYYFTPLLDVITDSWCGYKPYAISVIVTALSVPSAQNFVPIASHYTFPYSAHVQCPDLTYYCFFHSSAQ